METKEVKIEPLKVQRERLPGLIEDYWARAHRAREEGRPVAWVTGIMCSELLLSQGFFPVFPENHCAMCGTRRVSADLCAFAESLDYSPDLCSYAKTDLGSVFMGKDTLSPVGGLPRPDVLLLSNNQCITVTKWYEILARHFNVPILLVDTPHFHAGVTKEEEAAARRYAKEQLKEVVAFVERFTGRPYNWDALQECVANTREEARYFGEAIRLGRNIPSPLSCFDYFISLFGMLALRGWPEGVEYYRAFKAEVEERVAQGRAAVPQERFRLYWDNIAIWYRVGIHAKKFASHGATIPAAAYPYLVWMLPLETMDPSDPLEALAHAITTAYICYGVKERAEMIINLVREFHIDGLIMQSSRTCKPFLLGQPDIIRIVEERTGVPGVVVEGDMVDSRLFSDAHFDSRIDAFMEVLARRKGI